MRTLTADVVANLIRNVWSYAIIFCGHFPDQTYTFTQEETENESRGAWYVRQLTGAANIDGGPLFHVISGNLGYQVEHHLFPDMPSTRYGEIAPEGARDLPALRASLQLGPFHQQLGMVQRTIIRLAFPVARHRPKPGAYHGPLLRGKGERPASEGRGWEIGRRAWAACGGIPGGWVGGPLRMADTGRETLSSWPLAATARRAILDARSIATNKEVVMTWKRSFLVVAT